MKEREPNTYLFMIPHVDLVKEYPTITALCNDIKLPIQLKHSGSHMLKQCIEYMFITRVRQFSPLDYVVSYRSCAVAIVQIGGKLIRGITLDGSTNWGMLRWRKYLFYVPPDKLRSHQEPAIEPDEYDYASNWQLDREYYRLVRRD